MEELLAGLNERQREAVTATEGYVRVAAGAGSGKTRVLTARYAFIAKALGVSPDHILSVTFTNKAAQEMKRRIRAVLPEAEGGWILTFHSACHKILREEIGKLAYPSNFMVIDEEDQKELLQKIFRENGLTLKDFSFRDILDALEYYKSEDDYVPFLTDPLRRAAAPRLPEAEKPKSLHAVILQYLLAQRKNYYLDFNDLIQFTLFLFDTQPKVLEKWQKHFEYIQIDEFQDVSGEQYKLARLLSGLHGNLFIVGDPDQTIYSWRGADVGFFLNFPSLFKGARTVVLNKNYRSVPPLLDACNSLIAHNADRLEKKLVAVKTGGSAPVHFHARSRREECEWIAQNILGLRQRGIPLGDIAVLYRGNYMSRPVEEALLRKKVPYRVYGGVAFYRRKEIKDALAYLRVLVFGDDLSFLRAISVPARGIGKTRLALLRQYADEKGCSLFSALRALAAGRPLRGTGGAEFVSLIDRAGDFAKEHDVADVLDFLLQKSGMESFLALCGDRDRLDNLSELKSAVREYVESAGEETDIEGYLNGISLLTAADEEERGDCVKLMTVHTAKGLEFPYVFVCCLNEGLFPSRKIRGREEMEEERRVAYVALTRAENGLFLSDAEGFDAQLKGGLQTSRFAFDIERELLDIQGDVKDADDQRARCGKAAAPAGKAQRFSVGDGVRHPYFGAGKVLSAEGGAYLVRFENGKERSVSASSDVLIPLYAKKTDP